MKLSIVMPTVPGREHELDRTVEMYDRLTHMEIEWVIETGHDNCGAAWNAGVPKCTGEIVHMGADDLEPITDEWLPAALAVIEQGGVPLGWVFEDEIGRFGHDFCRVVICRRAWWRNVPEIHYWSDNAFDDLMRATGHKPTVAPHFDFYHRRSMVGRDELPERLERDRTVYLEVMSRPNQLQGPGHASAPAGGMA